MWLISIIYPCFAQSRLTWDKRKTDQIISVFLFLPANAARCIFYGAGINESVDSCYLFGIAEGLNEHFTAAKTEVSEFRQKVWTLFGNHSESVEMDRFNAVCHLEKHPGDRLLSMEKKHIWYWDVNRLLENWKCHPQLNNCNVHSFLTFYRGNRC